METVINNFFMAYYILVLCMSIGVCCLDIKLPSKIPVIWELLFSAFIKIAAVYCIIISLALIYARWAS